MTRSALNYWHVKKITEELLACGITNPGVRQICEGLRARGIRHSPASVYKHLLTWRSRWSRSSEPTVETVASNLHGGLRNSVHITAKSLVSLQEEIVHLRTQASDLADADEVLQNQIENLQGQLRDVGCKRAHLSARYDLLTEANERLRQEADCEREAAMQARLELLRNQFREENYTQRLEMQQAEIDQLGGLLREEQRRFIAAELARVRHETTNQYLSAELDESKRAEQSAKQTCVELRGRIDSLDQQSRSVVVQLTQVQGESMITRDQLARANEEISRLKQERLELTKRAEEVGARAVSPKPN